DPDVDGAAAEVPAGGLGERLAAEVPGPRRSRPDLVPVLRLDDGCVVARVGDAAERREFLVPDPVREREEVRELRGGLPGRVQWMGAGGRDDGGRGVGARGEVPGAGPPALVRAPGAADGGREGAGGGGREVVRHGSPSRPVAPGEGRIAEA